MKVTIENTGPAALVVYDGSAPVVIEPGVTKVIDSPDISPAMAGWRDDGLAKITAEPEPPPKTGGSENDIPGQGGPAAGDEPPPAKTTSKRTDTK